jgi:signal transduction histidine kinase
MVVSEIIRTQCETIGAYQSAEQAAARLAETRALAVMENEVFLGCLTCHDIAVNPRVLVIDCLLSKPTVRQTMPIAEALFLMRQHNTPALAVMENERYVGMVLQEDAVDYMHSISKEQKQKVYSVVHDLKAPVANIKALATMLDAPASADARALILHHAKNSCTQLSAFIDSILLEANTESQEPCVSVEINAFLKGCLASLVGSASMKKVTLANELNTEKIIVPLRPVEMRRAMQNILSNAIKFTPSGGTVRLSVSAERDSVMIRIQDSGIGIIEAMWPTVFARFTAAAKEGTDGEGSTGLGMYITKQIIEQHGGSIRFESAPETGTTFFVGLKR